MQPGTTERTQVQVCLSSNWLQSACMLLWKGLRKLAPDLLIRCQPAKTSISSISHLTWWNYFEIQCTSYKLLLNRIRLNETLAEACSQPSFDWSNNFKLQLWKFRKSKRDFHTFNCKIKLPSKHTFLKRQLSLKLTIMHQNHVLSGV